MIISKLLAHAETNPEKVAYIAYNEEITYGELLDKVHKYASLLKKVTNKPIIIYDDKSINFLILILSAIEAKIPYVPVSLKTPISRLKSIQKLTESDLIITNLHFSIENVLVSSISNIYIHANKNFHNQNETAYIIFTSGSTGEPKGVPITYENLHDFILWLTSLPYLKDYKDIKVLNQAHFSFDLSVADIFYTLFLGETLVSYQNEYLGIFKEIDVAFVTPTFMSLCLLDTELKAFNYPNLKCLYFCGEVLSKSLVLKIRTRFPNIKIINAYGPTEACSAVSAILIDDEILAKYETLPIGDHFRASISIVDGEIVLSGKCVFNGYLGHIKGGFFRKNGVNFYKTGDIGYFLDNKLFYKFRCDKQIKYKGYRIELNDIEYNLNKVKGVVSSAVIPIYDSQNQIKLLKAFVVLDDLAYNRDYLIAALKELIPDYMLPKIIKIVKSLPLTSNGKIDRKALENDD